MLCFVDSDYRRNLYNDHMWEALPTGRVGMVTIATSLETMNMASLLAVVSSFYSLTLTSKFFSPAQLGCSMDLWVRVTDLHE